MARYKRVNTVAHSLINFIVMWTITHFPSAMRSLTPSTRAKAIEIANQLLEQGRLDKECVVTMSVAQARRWARYEREWPLANALLYA